jgi:hypothetical protein
MQLCNHRLIHNHDLLCYLVNWLSPEDVWKLRRIDRKTKQIIESDSCNEVCVDEWTKCTESMTSLIINDYLYYIRLFNNNRLWHGDIVKLIPYDIQMRTDDDNLIIYIKPILTISADIYNNKICKCYDMTTIIPIPVIFQKQQEFFINLQNIYAIKK